MILQILGIIVSVIIVFGLGWFICVEVCKKKHLQETAKLNNDHEIALGQEEDKRGEVETKLAAALAKQAEDAKEHEKALAGLAENCNKAAVDLKTCEQKLAESEKMHVEAKVEAAKVARDEGFSAGRKSALGEPLPLESVTDMRLFVLSWESVGRTVVGLAKGLSDNRIRYVDFGPKADFPAETPFVIQRDEGWKPLEAESPEPAPPSEPAPATSSVHIDSVFIVVAEPVPTAPPASPKVPAAEPTTTASKPDPGPEGSAQS